MRKRIFTRIACVRVWSINIKKILLAMQCGHRILRHGRITTAKRVKCSRVRHRKHQKIPWRGSWRDHTGEAFLRWFSFILRFSVIRCISLSDFFFTPHPSTVPSNSVVALAVQLVSLFSLPIRRTSLIVLSSLRTLLAYSRCEIWKTDEEAEIFKCQP